MVMMPNGSKYNDSNCTATLYKKLQLNVPLMQLYMTNTTYTTHRPILCDEMTVVTVCTDEHEHECACFQNLN
jgi:hypothetical protein